LLQRIAAARRLAKKKKATPSWLTREQLDQIRAVYSEAVRLTKETGIPHEVDHIVPLSGKTVSGLHVPWNLRAIPAVENNRRPRVWTEDIAA
jgi:5-methylcytosine-specific restriction endonuclease McrA